MSEPKDRSALEPSDQVPDHSDPGRADDESIPKLFATIHWKSPLRPNGYTPEQVAEINEFLNRPKPPKAIE
jgi:hypothetical protein